MDCVQSQTKHRSRTSGSVLIFVLALVVLLSVMAMRLMDESIREMEHVSQFHRRDDLRIHAYSALDITVGTLSEWKEIRGSLTARNRGWGNPLKYAEIAPPEGIKWNVGLTVENGKYSLEQLRKDHTNRKTFLFEMMVDDENDPVSPRDSLEYVDTFHDWEDKDDNHRLNGAESSDYYEDLEPVYFSPNRPIQSFNEFRLIKGFGHGLDDPEDSGLFFDARSNETANVKNFKNSVSSWSSHKPNDLEATDFLLRFLFGENESGFDQYMRQRAKGKEPSPAPGCERVCRVFRVKVTVSRGPANFVLWAILEDSSSKTNKPPPSNLSPEAKAAQKRFKALKYPYRILALRENENFID